MNPVHFVVRLMPVAILLFTAGCFRPAGESIEPTTGVLLPQESPTLQPTIIQPSDTPTEVLETIASSPTSTLSSINLNTPTDAIATEIQPTPNQSSIQSVTTQQGTAFPTFVPATSTPRFITPGSPLGPVTPDTPTPTSDVPPTSTPSGLITPTSLPGTEEDDCAYIVQPGDNLYQIATTRGFTVDDMLVANPDLVGDPPILQVGQTLQLPECETTPTPLQVTVQITPFAGATQPIAPVGGGQVYIVQPGDTLYGISLTFGVTVQAIIDANNLLNPDRLDVGQQLIIPPPSS